MPNHGGNPPPPRPAPRLQPEADAQCVAAVLAGQRERFGELIERYQGAVTAVVRGYVKDAHTAEDVAQEVFVTAFTALPQLRQPSLFFPWLLQIARHRASQSGRRTSRAAENVPLTGAENAPAAFNSRDDRIAEVLRQVEQLPEPYRQTVLLKYSRNLSCKQIAEQDGVAVGTITSRLTRALVMLRNSLCDKER